MGYNDYRESLLIDLRLINKKKFSFFWPINPYLGIRFNLSANWWAPILNFFPKSLEWIGYRKDFLYLSIEYFISNTNLFIYSHW